MNRKIKVKEEVEKINTFIIKLSKWLMENKKIKTTAVAIVNIRGKEYVLIIFLPTNL